MSTELKSLINIIMYGIQQMLFSKVTQSCIEMYTPELFCVAKTVKCVEFAEFSVSVAFVKLNVIGKILL